MPSMRVIVGGAIGCLFVCGLFGGQAAAQTASTEPVGKPIQLLQLTHPGKPEAKPYERSAAKHTIKFHLAAKKPASPKLASKESTSNGAPHVTAAVAAAAAPQAPPAPTSETAWPAAAQASVAESVAAVSATCSGRRSHRATDRWPDRAGGLAGRCQRDRFGHRARRAARRCARRESGEHRDGHAGG